MRAGRLHLIKLCVGAEGVDDLLEWQARVMAERGVPAPVHVTRMWPKREAELVDGGSLYWVFRGFVLARQRILRLEERVGADGIRRCGLVLDPQVARTASQPRRAFQGWRYLAAKDAPRDLTPAAALDNLPAGLMARLDAMGVL